MLAHGADYENTDEETFRQICVMYADGLIGNRIIIETLGNLTAGVYNYMRDENKSPYKLRDIIGKTHDYLYPPQDTKKAVNEALLVYMTQAKGFDINKFKVAQ